MIELPALAARWRTLCQRLHLATASAGEWARLVEAYTQPQRAYHTLQHIADCLQQFDLANTEGLPADDIELALWFHDVVYDPRASDNEAQSAAWAVAFLQANAIAPARVDRVYALILATQHHASPTDPEAALVVDIDLSILGRIPAEFDEYERNIRQEYLWVDADRYRAGRAQILEMFLRRAPLYRTALFRERYEACAKENLQRSLRVLRERK